jgi:hypothetical protein
MTVRLPTWYWVLVTVFVFIIAAIALTQMSHGLVCSNTTYSNEWNLTYLRNVTSFCSDGGD